MTDQQDNHIIRLVEDTAPARVVTGRGIVLVIDGAASPTTLETITQEAERRYPEPAPPKVIFDQYGAGQEEPITRQEDAAYWARVEPEKYGALPDKLAAWQVLTRTNVARAAGFVMTELIVYGVSVDVEATKAGGAPTPDFALSWRDRVPRYGEEPSPELRQWREYLEFAIPTTVEWGAVAAAIQARLQSPTPEGVAEAIELFRTQMAARRGGAVAAALDAPGAQTEVEPAANQTVDVGHGAADGQSVGPRPRRVRRAAPAR